jgi:pantoate--beta-alanine ligase
MSSRNAYLGGAERAAATVLSRALREATDAVVGGERDAGPLRALLEQRIASEPAVRLDYAEVVDAAALTPVDRVDGTVLLAVAAFVGRARLIDNAVVTVSTSDVEVDLGVLVTESEPQCAAS